MNEKFDLRIDYLPSVNYAMMNNGFSTLNSLVIENTGDEDLNLINITISGLLIKESSCIVEHLNARQSMQMKNLVIEPDINALCETTEAVNTTFRVSANSGDTVLFDNEYPIRLLAFDEWAGIDIMPELLASFVIPNHPLLSRVKVTAAKFLEQLTGSSAIDEYQTQNRNRVRAQVAAIYEALRSEGIVYSTPPASFEKTGQRVRTADKVLTEKVATCLDTSLLMASCLEDAGIYPVLLIFKGHATVGAWLTPTVPAQMVGDDPNYLLREIADGNNNLVVMESTTIAMSEYYPFESTVETAMKTLDEKLEKAAALLTK